MKKFYLGLPLRPTALGRAVPGSQVCSALQFFSLRFKKLGSGPAGPPIHPSAEALRAFAAALPPAGRSWLRSFMA
ncbi:hypothetical protein SGRA_1181 [Saprospira grandis str. Lewin]|uniref:Uncharacterized protein n=1 Tax=Saprospira grandis (strain Lewin) TaxID=984262 RepID=H6L4J2_SAPGL|nr:hypothetical protein SGRA_1181 [Saprospira grandis str. Lewin]